LCPRIPFQGVLIRWDPTASERPNELEAFLDAVAKGPTTVVFENGAGQFKSKLLEQFVGLMPGKP
jgi:hypothetical protein